MEETATTDRVRGILTAPRRILLFSVGLLLVSAAEVVLNAARWLDVPDPFRFLKRWDGVLPVFDTPRFGAHFGPALLLMAAGLALVFVALFRLPGGGSGDTVLALDVRPLSLDLRPGRWRVAALLLSPLAVATIVVLGRELHRGPAPGAPAFLGCLAAVGLTLHAVDRARGARLLSGREVLGAAAYVALLLALGFGYRSEATVVPTIAAGLLLAAVLVRTRALAPEWALFGVVALLGYAVYATNLTSWRYANIGDEWAYFGFASRLAREPGSEPFFSMQGVYGQHPVLAGYAQAFTLRLYDANPYGWRLSESLFVFLAALPVYAAVRCVARPRAALVAAVVFLSSQVLLGASRAGYSLSQGVLPWPTAIAFLLLAARRGSLLGLFLAGVSACWAFFTCAVALPLIGVPGLVFIVLFLVPGLPGYRVRSAVLATLPFSAGLALTALPGLLDAAWIRMLVAQTAAQNRVRSESFLLDQVVPNFLSMLTAVLHFPVSSHYVSGPHLDPISSALMMLGLLTALGLACSSRATRAGANGRLQIALLLAFPIICFVIGGLVPYPYPSIPRTNVLVPFYALFAALGAERLLAALEALRGRALPRSVLVAAPVALALVPLANLYSFRVLMERGRGLTDISMLLRELETTTPRTRLAVVVPSRQSSLNIRNVLDCSRHPRERTFFLPEFDPEGTLRALARRVRAPHVVMVPGDMPTADDWLRGYARLLPRAAPTEVRDAAGNLHFHRLPIEPSPTGTVPGGLDPSAPPHVVGSIPVEEPRDVAVTASGKLLVLVGETVEVRERDGRLVRTLAPRLVAPVALAAEPDGADGAFLVLDGSPARLVRVGSDGTVAATARLGPFGLEDPRGLAVSPSGGVAVADPATGKVVRLTRELALAGEVVGTVPFVQPTTVAFVGTRLVVSDVGSTVVFDEGGREVARWAAVSHGGPVEPPRILAGQERVVVTVSPAVPSLLVHDLAGNLLQEAGPPDYMPLVHASGIAATRDGLVFVGVAEPGAVRVYDWAAP